MVYSSGDNPGEQVMGFRVNMRHIDCYERSLSKRTQSAVERSKRQAEMISATLRRKQMEIHASVDAAGDLKTPVHVGNGEFLMEIGYGSPAIVSKAVVDTGSEFIWTQCQPCKQCYNQSVPFYDPSKSSTFSQLACNDSLCKSALQAGQARCKVQTSDCLYDSTYASSKTSSKGYFVYDTLTFGGGANLPQVGFGCGNENTGGPVFQGDVTGIVGMGRGPLSLISQVGASLGKKRFSYCFLSYDKYFGGPPKTSPLLFGQLAVLNEKTQVQTVKFVKNDKLSLFYYIPITSIAVGGKDVDIPAGTFDVKEDGSGGMIIDSGTSLLQLVEAAYTPLAGAFKAGINLTAVDGSSIGLDLCYAVKSGSSPPSVPSLTFNFEGDVKYEFPTENYFRQSSDELFCLAVVSVKGQGQSSVLGNIAQQNFHILYDEDSASLSFQTAQCDSV
ncbi:aspartic proteinase nepenthesin-1 [Cryptomeria japonica]|uniref:aspartic proteinase nepenthesin-1 n=1 Tax=Cryptomeria japonica TaxID=3369 RepID=UPI0025ACB739|nr:aspartic proteinase nepenthesin-1 [Cryptomeria japonica]